MTSHPRTVLVTGAARRVGATIARYLAGKGWRVVLHYSASRPAAQSLADALGGAVVGGDLADSADVAAFFARARAAAGGPITALVNNASAFEYDAPGTLDPTLAARLYAINCTAPVLLAEALAAQEDLDDGVVVNLLDQKLANPNPDFFSYSCSKFALAGATTMLAQAFAPRVRVNAVAPGLILPSGTQSAADFARVAAANLLRRPVGAEAIAEAVAYLLAARSVTGQTLYVDCGQRFVKSARDVMFEGSDG